MGMVFTRSTTINGMLKIFSFGDETDFKYLNLEPFKIGNKFISSTENISQKWLDNFFHALTFRLNYIKNSTKLNFGGFYSVYDGDHYGKIIWQTILHMI